MKKNTKRYKESEFRVIKRKFNESFKKFKEKYELDEDHSIKKLFTKPKMDIQEEIDRLEVHLDKLKKLFQKETEVGRQIDFLYKKLIEKQILLV